MNTGNTFRDTPIFLWLSIFDLLKFQWGISVTQCVSVMHTGAICKTQLLVAMHYAVSDDVLQQEAYGLGSYHFLPGWGGVCL